MIKVVFEKILLLEFIYKVSFKTQNTEFTVD